jgi:hypothetical protein
MAAAIQAGLSLPESFCLPRRLFPYGGAAADSNPSGYILWTEFLFISELAYFDLWAHEKGIEWGRYALLRDNLDPFSVSVAAIDRFLRGGGQSVAAEFCRRRDVVLDGLPDVRPMEPEEWVAVRGPWASAAPALTQEPVPNWREALWSACDITAPRELTTEAAAAYERVATALLFWEADFWFEWDADPNSALDRLVKLTDDADEAFRAVETVILQTTGPDEISDVVRFLRTIRSAARTQPPTNESWKLTRELHSIRRFGLYGPADVRSRYLPDVLDRIRQQLAHAASVPGGGPEQPTIYYHGKQSYSTDGVTPVVVGDRHHEILQAFLTRRAAMSTVQLEKAAFGVVRTENVSQLVKRLQKLHSGRFSPAIQTPNGVKGAGYFIRVQPAPGR